MSECTCPPTAQLLRETLEGHDIACEVHRPQPPDPEPDPLALNGDPLEASLRNKLGITPTETAQPLDAA